MCDHGMEGKAQWRRREARAAASTAARSGHVTRTRGRPMSTRSSSSPGPPRSTPPRLTEPGTGDESVLGGCPEARRPTPPHPGHDHRCHGRSPRRVSSLACSRTAKFSERVRRSVDRAVRAGAWPGIHRNRPSGCGFLRHPRLRTQLAGSRNRAEDRAPPGDRAATGARTQEWTGRSMVGAARFPLRAVSRRAQRNPFSVSIDPRRIAA